MGADRVEKLALNEATFRVANERISAWEERNRQDTDELEPYYCECSSAECSIQVRLYKAEYEAARRNSMHFIVAPGHADLSLETVVEQNERFNVVCKHEEARDLVEATDSRRR